MMEEKRPASRVRTILNGQIIFNNRSATLDCVVRNLSDSGAKLEASSAVTLPERFELVIPRKGETYRARAVWRTEREIGVAFEPRQETVASGPSERLKALTDENARLRRRLAELTTQSGEA